MSLRLPLTSASLEWQRFEAGVRKLGYSQVAGIDEVGRGCLAGPVVAAAVILPDDARLPGVADSKQLSPARREELYPLILDVACAVRVGEASAQEIDRINILKATQLAMTRALEALSPPADFLLIDGNARLPVAIPQRTIVKGDSLCLSIAAASIVAKVTRDRMMAAMSAVFPEYGFERHKGYGTAEHLEALRRNGPCPLHRRSFRGVLPEPTDLPADDASREPVLVLPGLRPRSGGRS